MRTDRQLQSGLNCCPENLALLEEGEILRLLQLELRNEDRLAKVVAEGLHRAWLACQVETPALSLDGLPGSDDRRRFLAAAAHYRIDPPGDLRRLRRDGLAPCPPGSFAARVHGEFLGRMLRSLEAAGVVPLAGETGGTWVLFDLRPRPAGAAAVVDARMAPVEEWSRHVESLSAYEPLIRHWQVRLHLSQWDRQDLFPRFTGCSLQLPVLLAAWRKTGRLPEYRPLDLVATGCFDDGRLAPVAGVGAKAESAFRLLACQCFLAPREHSRGRTRIHFLPRNCRIGVDLEKACAEAIEEHGLAPMTAGDAEMRIRQLERDIRSGLQREWDLVSRQLDRYQVALDPDANPEACFRVGMLQSAALCHVGRPGQALALNRRMQGKAVQAGRLYEYLKMQIEALVVLTDLEQWDEIGRLAGPLKRKIARARLPEEFQRDDLWMRYHGTLGQYVAYAALRGLRPAGKALDHFQEAIRAAGRLGEPQELVRDFNYRHLWYALFHPGTPEELEMYRLAYDGTCRELRDDHQRRKNLDYLARQRIFAVYRAWLTDGVLPTRRELEALPAPGAGAEPWLQAAMHKYRGGLLAASGDFKAAQVEFEQGLNSLADPGAPVIDFIRMTIATQAWQSLRQHPGHAEFAEACHHQAEEFCRQNPNLPETPPWSHWLAGDALPGHANPQLAYQY